MKIEEVKKLPALERLAYWIRERESIRLKRKQGLPAPWTDDSILSAYRFCNVRRMDDKVSQWLFNNWYEPYFDHRNMPAACALARLINLPDSLQEIGFPDKWQPQRIKKILRARVDRGLSVYNGAYMIRGGGNPDKVGAVVDWYVGPMISKRPEVLRHSMQGTWSNIYEYFGMGSFMAGQVVADMRHAMNGTWLDRYVWAPMGPGSKRGMNRLLGNSLNAPMSQTAFLDDLQNMITNLDGYVPQTVTNRMEAIDFQNCLCEFDKYERTLFDNRRPKQLYRGG